MKDLPYSSDRKAFSDAAHLLTINYNDIQCSVWVPCDHYEGETTSYHNNIRLWAFHHIHRGYVDQYGRVDRVEIVKNTCPECKRKFPSPEVLITSIRLQLFKDPSKLGVVYGHISSLDE
jgi:hypothetical protein